MRPVELRVNPLLSGDLAHERFQPSVFAPARLVDGERHCPHPTCQPTILLPYVCRSYHELGACMSQHVREKQEPTRVPLGAFVERSQRDQLAAIAQRDDRSVSSIVRLALAGYIEREHEENS